MRDFLSLPGFFIILLVLSKLQAIKGSRNAERGVPEIKRSADGGKPRDILNDAEAVSGCDVEIQRKQKRSEGKYHHFRES